LLNVYWSFRLCRIHARLAITCFCPKMERNTPLSILCGSTRGTLCITDIHRSFFEVTLFTPWPGSYYSTLSAESIMRNPAAYLQNFVTSESPYAVHDVKQSLHRPWTDVQRLTGVGHVPEYIIWQPHESMKWLLATNSIRVLNRRGDTAKNSPGMSKELVLCYAKRRELLALWFNGHCTITTHGQRRHTSTHS
jgi:hypothetical protein